MTTAIKSISLSLELNTLCEKYKISLSEATRVGVCVMLSELGEQEYMNKTNLGRKIHKLVGIINEMQQKLEKYEDVAVQK